MGVKNGIGLINSISNKYPNKIITVYSSQPLPNDSHFTA